MIKKYLEKIIAEKTGLTTYGIGLIQFKAYRALKNHTTEVLKNYDITTMDWALLGLLYENKEGIGVMDLAEELAVEAPFVTVLVKDLEKKKLVEKKVSNTDKRAKAVKLTNYGMNFVEKTEEIMKEKTRKLIEGLSVNDVLGYHKVLKTLVQNYKK